MDPSKLDYVGVPLWRYVEMEKPYVVVDTKDVEPGEQCPVLGWFDTEQEASEFIGTLPEYETGRYGLDGPPDDV
jgi:hypothetical protein